VTPPQTNPPHPLPQIIRQLHDISDRTVFNDALGLLITEDFQQGKAMGPFLLKERDYYFVHRQGKCHWSNATGCPGVSKTQQVMFKKCARRSRL
jgi:hypothetical protein